MNTATRLEGGTYSVPDDDEILDGGLLVADCLCWDQGKDDAQQRPCVSVRPVIQDPHQN
jgi:hypothetical protein